MFLEKKLILRLTVSEECCSIHNWIIRNESSALLASHLSHYTHHWTHLQSSIDSAHSLRPNVTSFAVCAAWLLRLQIFRSHQLYLFLKNPNSLSSLNWVSSYSIFSLRKNINCWNSILAANNRQPVMIWLWKVAWCRFYFLRWIAELSKTYAWKLSEETGCGSLCGSKLTI